MVMKSNILNAVGNIEGTHNYAWHCIRLTMADHPVSVLRIIIIIIIVSHQTRILFRMSLSAWFWRYEWEHSYNCVTDFASMCL